MLIAALHVETGGCYFGMSGVDPWDIERDALRYDGPYPVVAHPDCRRWGRFWHGSTRKPHQFKLGDDGGKFASASTPCAVLVVSWSIPPTARRGIILGWRNPGAAPDGRLETSMEARRAMSNKAITATWRAKGRGSMRSARRFPS